MLFGFGPCRPLIGGIEPKAGYASIAYDATSDVRLSSPGLTPIPREARKSLSSVKPAKWRVRRRSPSAFERHRDPRWSRKSSKQQDPIAKAMHGNEIVDELVMAFWGDE
jgi:hypothetical protein